MVLEDRLAELAARFEAYLGEVLPAAEVEPRELSEAMRYAALGGGKRVRPALAMLWCEAVGGEVAQALPAAAAVECVHVYSLVHDDLPAMDDDDLRRGRPSCHKAFGEAMAILAGDALLTFAFEHAAAYEEPGIARDIVLELARRAGTSGMVGGQVLDLRGEGRTSCEPARDEGALEAIHAWKTGALITSACVGGAIAGGGGASARAAARAYGESLGLLFQVTDDIIDITSSTEELGKTAGKDAERGKLTYPSLLGLDGARARAATLASRASAALAELAPTAARSHLEAMVLFIRDRTR
jgi:geranylgeranyl pyrophosphate synthase